MIWGMDAIRGVPTALPIRAQRMESRPGVDRFTPAEDAWRPLDARTVREPDLQGLDAQFTGMRPADKQRFLDAMDPQLRARWDAWQAERQQAFSDAHPAVPPLHPAAERSIRQALLHRYPDAHVEFDRTAPVDCDGAGPSYGDALTDFETSITIGGAPLNADDVLYHVNTMDRPDLNDALALNFYHGRMVPSIFGDEGPARGEASHLTIQLLGMYSSPIDGGDRAGHDMYFIPGLGAEFMRTGRQPTPDNLTAFCRSRNLPGFQK